MSKKNNDKTIINTNVKKGLFIGFILFIIVFIFCLQSPLNPFIKGESLTDSSVFKTVSQMMHHGYMPYLDIFDHKGPLIYIFNYIGDYISNYRGIWIIELISLFISCIYFYKTARLKCDEKISIFITIISLTALSIFFEFGNLVEEYALPFIAYSIYVFLDYLLNNKVNNKRIIGLGICFGSVLMLRPNMIITWPLFCIYIFIKLMIEKNYKQIFSYIFYFVIGTLIIVLPIILWLAFNNALNDFIYQYLTFNSKYTSTVSHSEQILNCWNSLIKFINYPIIYLSILPIFIRKNKINILYLVYIIASLLLISMSGRVYLHYMMIFIPVLIYPLSLLFDYLNESNIAEKTIIIIISAFMILPMWSPIIEKLPSYFILRNTSNISEETNTINNLIVSNTTDEDKITVYGNKNIYYILSKRITCSKYSYQFPISEVNENILNEYFDDLKSEQPKIIIIQKEHIDDKINEYISDNKYELLYPNKEDINKYDNVYILK